MYLLVITWILITTGPAVQTPRPAPAPSISTEKIATYKSLAECTKAAQAFATDPADRDPSTTGFTLITRTACAPVEDADSVVG